MTPEDAGLCGTCAHARAIRSDRGSVFYLCGLSRDDARFPKYPRLPVLACAGYRNAGEQNEERKEGTDNSVHSEPLS